MTKWIRIFFALTLLAAFSFGCSGISKDTQVKCPQCGAVFTIDEGLTQEQMRPGSGGGF